MPREQRRRLTLQRLLKGLGYWPLRPLLWLLGNVPFGVLYAFSDFMRWAVCDAIGYRRRVIHDNILIAFPDRSEAEREVIRQEFNRNLIDNFVEALPLRFGPRQRILARISHTVTPEAAELLARHPNVVIAQGHMGQLEWSCYVARVTGRPTYYVYKELQHPDFDRLMFDTRSATGSVLYEMGDARAFIAEHVQRPGAFAFIADQSPMAGRGIWVNFFNRPTAFFEGIEKFARQYQMPVLFHTVRQRGRGCYDWALEVLVTNPAELPPGGIVARYAHRLEADIRAQPALWWWSHKRWKHTPPPDVQLPIV